MSRLSGIPFRSTVNFASILDGDEDIRTITVPGASNARGDMVLFANVGGTWGGLSVFAEVNTENTVRFIGLNNTGATVDNTTQTVHGIVVPGDVVSGY
jgi:tryptophan synthase beta subunit